MWISSMIVFIIMLSSMHGCSLCPYAAGNQDQRKCCHPIPTVETNPDLIAFDAISQPQNYVPILNTGEFGEQLNLTICLNDGSQLPITMTRQLLDYKAILYPPETFPEGKPTIPRYEGKIIGQEHSNVYGILNGGIFIGSITFAFGGCWQQFDVKAAEYLNLTGHKLAPFQKAKIDGCEEFHSVALFFDPPADWHKCGLSH